jgi:hypothetical protein
MKFIPEENQKVSEVPFLEDARSDDGWQGHGTGERVAALRAQISAEIGRLGGTVTRWLPGMYEIDDQKRPGIQIGYQIVGPGGSAFEGRIDVAGLPWRDPYGGKKSHGGYKTAVENKKDTSLRMALYNVRQALIAMRNLQMLSPGYAALIPWMLKPGTDQTLGEMWGIGSKALPAPSDEGEILEADFEVIDEEAKDV